LAINQNASEAALFNALTIYQFRSISQKEK